MIRYKYTIIFQGTIQLYCISELDPRFLNENTIFLINHINKSTSMQPITYIDLINNVQSMNLRSYQYVLLIITYGYNKLFTLSRSIIT